ncbi:MAG: hypothetical protein GOV02_01890 [Candidatus Aenigmarchaeota archaeon]|nr:hypothetical protein [Candidatus Aenigmarchaeota archaeon]
MAIGYTFPVEKEMACAKSTLSVSAIHAQTVCKKINGKEFLKAKKFIEDVRDEKVSINGRYYTKTVTEIAKLLHTAEANAIAQNHDTEAMKLFISVSKGPRLYRAKRKRSFGLAMKIANLQVILKPFVKKQKKTKVEPKKETKKEVPKEEPKVEVKEEPKSEEKVEEKKEEPKVEEKKEEPVEEKKEEPKVEEVKEEVPKEEPKSEGE